MSEQYEPKPVFDLRPFGDCPLLLANEPFCDLLSLAISQRTSGRGDAAKQLDALTERLSGRHNPGKRFDIELNYDIKTYFGWFSGIALRQELAKRILRILQDRQASNNLFEAPLFNLMTKLDTQLHDLWLQKDQSIPQVDLDVRPFYGRLYLVGTTKFFQLYAKILEQREPTPAAVELHVSNMAKILTCKLARKPRPDISFDPNERAYFEVRLFFRQFICVGLDQDIVTPVMRAFEDYRDSEGDDVDETVDQFLTEAETYQHQLRAYRQCRLDRQGRAS